MVTIPLRRRCVNHPRKWALSRHRCRACLKVAGLAEVGIPAHRRCVNHPHKWSHRVGDGRGGLRLCRACLRDQGARTFESRVAHDLSPVEIEQVFQQAQAYQKWCHACR